MVEQSPSIALKNRIDNVPLHVDAYIDQENVTTSTGIRLYIWETVWYAFLEQPIIGHGPGNFKGLTYQSMLRDNYDIETYIYGYAHNECLHALATKGLVGFVMLFGIFIVPLLAVIRLYRQHEVIYAFALAGTTLIFACFVLTNMVLMKGSGAKLYTFLVATLMSLGFLSIASRPHHSSNT